MLGRRGEGREATCAHRGSQKLGYGAREGGFSSPGFRLRACVQESKI